MHENYKFAQVDSEALVILLRYIAGFLCYNLFLFSPLSVLLEDIKLVESSEEPSSIKPEDPKPKGKGTEETLTTSHGLMHISIFKRVPISGHSH